jgi:hypothetical protein
MEMIIPQAVCITYSSQVQPQTISQVRKVSPVQDNGLMCSGITDRRILARVIYFLQRYVHQEIYIYIFICAHPHTDIIIILFIYFFT